MEIRHIAARGLHVAATLGLLAGTGAVFAQSPYRQCNLEDPPLARTESGVIPGDPVFQRRGKTYQAAIFGLGAPNPEVQESPYEICLRYEFENKSDETIQELRWPDAGLGHVRSVAPGERIRIPMRRVRNTTDVAAFPTQVYAFENVAASSRTVLPATTSPDRPSNQPAPDHLYEFSLTELFPAFLEAVPANVSANNTVLAVFTPEEAREYPTLRTGLESSTVSVSIESTASVSPQDFVGRIETEIRIEGDFAGDATVYSPLLAALDSAPFDTRQPIPARTAELLTRIPPAPDSSITLSNRNYASSVTFRPSGLEEPSLFITEHPVTIVIGEWTACLIAQAYSPAPVGLFESHCRAPQ